MTLLKRLELCNKLETVKTEKDLNIVVDVLIEIINELYYSSPSETDE